ncbi:hypothetical protein [Nonomuraea longicatena]|uniref:Uncharacterized protein n=1 Tax=Nonomuraea longicatena TaxID=83682 RepID=A0ABP3Z2H9_9ACTN
MLKITRFSQDRVWTVIRLTAYSLFGAALAGIGIWGPSVVRVPGMWFLGLWAVYLVQAVAETIHTAGSRSGVSGR